MGKVNKQNVIARSNDYYGTTDTLQYTYRRLLPRQTTATGSNDLRSHTTIRGVDILMEQHGARKRSTDFRCGQKLGQRDHLIVIPKPRVRPYWMDEAHYEDAPDTITVRELKVGGKILVTTMNCPKTYSKGAIKTLYQSRWHVELDIRHIKETMGMNVLSSKTP